MTAWLTYAALCKSITIVTRFTFLTVETFCVEKTFEAFTSLIITVANIIWVNVSVTVTCVTCTVDLRRVTKVILITGSTVWSFNNNIECVKQVKNTQGRHFIVISLHALTTSPRVIGLTDVSISLRNLPVNFYGNHRIIQSSQVFLL